MDEKLTELLESLSDWDRGKRSGQHWGNNSNITRAEPAARHPLDDLRFGIQDAMTQARLAAEGRLLSSPGANLPQLKPSDGSWVAYLYPNGVGMMDGLIKGFFYSLGNRIWPDHRSQRLAWDAFAGFDVLVCVPRNGQTDWKNSERRQIVSCDHSGVYLDSIVTIGGPECREYAVSFAIPGK
jgi:hypothetical protein